MIFNTGDKVFKCKPYSESQYCAHGGNEIKVPIGTDGVIIDMKDQLNAHVSFSNGVEWLLHISELSLIKNNWREIYDNF